VPRQRLRVTMSPRRQGDRQLACRSAEQTATAGIAPLARFAQMIGTQADDCLADEGTW